MSRSFSQSLGPAKKPDGTNESDNQPIPDEQVQATLAGLNSNDALIKAANENPDLLRRVLETAFVRSNAEILDLQNKFDQLEIDVSRQQEQQQRDSDATTTSYEQQITDLDQQLARALSTDTTQTKPETLNPKRSARSPDPPIYTGDRATLEQFITKLKFKLKDNADWYPSEAAKVRYAYGRLEGKAGDQIHPRMNENSSTHIKDIEELVAALRLSFGDADKQNTAQQYILKLRQTNKPFSEYLSLFLSKAGDTGFDEETQKFHLQNGLCQELSNHLVGVRVHKLSFNELVEECQFRDTRDRQHRERFSKSGPKITHSVTTSTAAPAVHVHTSTNDGNTAMDLSKIGSKPRGPLTSEEKQRRRDHQLCLYCGEPGHHAANCEKKPSNRTNIRTVTSAPTAPVASEGNEAEKA